MASVDACESKEDIIRCPSLCRERCQKDTKFLTSFSQECMDSIDRSTKDQPNCSIESPIQPEEPPMQPDTNCDKSVAALGPWIEEISTELKTASEVYAQITTGEFDNIDKYDKLCKFTFDEINKSYQLSIGDKSSFDKITVKIDYVDVCASQINRKLENFPPGKLHIQHLLEDTLNVLEKHKKTLNEVKVELGTTTNKLTSTAENLKLLVELHRINCLSQPLTNR